MKHGWRWTQWVVFFVAIAVYLPTLLMKETYASVILERRGQNCHSNTTLAKSLRLPNLNHLKTFLKTNLIRPLAMLFTEPIVAAFGLYFFLVLAIVYQFVAGIPYVFASVYHFNNGEQGLVFFGNASGFILGGATVVVGTRNMIKEARARKKKPDPEDGLQLAKLGGLTLPPSLLLFGWLAKTRSHWIFPILSTVPITWSIFLVYVSVPSTKFA